MNPPKQFKTMVTVRLLEMDEHVTVLGYKCNLKVLEDVKVVVFHKHTNHIGKMHMLLKLNKESFYCVQGK